MRIRKPAFLKSHPRAFRTFFFLICLALLYGIFATGYLIGQKGNVSIGFGTLGVKNTEVGKPSDLDFSIFWQAWNKLKNKSVAAPDSQKMIYGAISGMLSSVGDPYTVFFTPEDNKRFSDDIGGQFEGIGLELEYKNQLVTVVAPLSDTPAEQAGFKPGDIIVEVDGTKATDLGYNGTVEKIRGQAGTSVKLKVERTGVDQLIELSVTRAKITVKSVEWQMKESGGKKFLYVKIRQFGDDTDRLFSQFAAEAVKDKPDGIIVDLRNNPGGYLESAINLSSYFLDGGTVVIEKDKNGVDQEYKTTNRPTLKDFNVAVLVNGGSASASEIFSGALQDRHAGKIIGDKTFGKGSVQELISLPDGSAVKITIAKWLTPNGRTINGEGLVPDIAVKNDENSKNDAQLDRGIEYLKTGK